MARFFQDVVNWVKNEVFESVLRHLLLNLLAFTGFSAIGIIGMLQAWPEGVLYLIVIVAVVWASAITYAIKNRRAAKQISELTDGQILGILSERQKAIIRAIGDVSSRCLHYQDVLETLSIDLRDGRAHSERRGLEKLGLVIYADRVISMTDRGETIHDLLCQQENDDSEKTLEEVLNFLLTGRGLEQHITGNALLRLIQQEARDCRIRIRAKVGVANHPVFENAFTNGIYEDVDPVTFRTKGFEVRGDRWVIGNPAWGETFYYDPVFRNAEVVAFYERYRERWLKQSVSQQERYLNGLDQ